MPDAHHRLRLGRAAIAGLGTSRSAALSLPARATGRPSTLERRASNTTLAGCSTILARGSGIQKQLAATRLDKIVAAVSRPPNICHFTFISCVLVYFVVPNPRLTAPTLAFTAPVLAHPVTRRLVHAKHRPCSARATADSSALQPLHSTDAIRFTDYAIAIVSFRQPQTCRDCRR
jgi:hypothetical protein